MLAGTSAVVLPRAFHHPAQDDRDEHERDEGSDQRPEHGRETYRNRHDAGSRNAPATTTRGARPAPGPTGTPRRPASAAPAGRRTATASEDAAPPDGLC